MNATVITQQPFDANRFQTQNLTVKEPASNTSGYALAIGAIEVKRLNILNQLYGHETERLLLEAGLDEGMQVVDVGCGTGNITRWLAQQVGDMGSVIGLDASSAQIEQALILTNETGLTNVTFQVGDIYNPGLPLHSFDLVYCRLVLMHLTHPIAALRQLKALLKPGGKLVCEEMDLSFMMDEPESEVFTRMRELNLALSDLRNQHYRLGSYLFQLFPELGLSQITVNFHIPSASQGESKRLIELSLAQLAPAFVQENLITQAEFDQLFGAFKQLSDNPTVLFRMPLMGQVWAINA
ncbi:methyltransferase domain-containing protein [Kovacikia minuta CCNUW1]|uniref:class I SAM-dependent methyltransferase n=1 Tax=Kovacikia minuta TaxID=2931930 RepID=UPI001CCFAB57|nr:class I SAM-dependent methyltransferase [Kovacikia minuta]UBF28285.1 methyltransferase domain-containing protein [Kovacikia minuta CCNUW1]